MDDYIGRESLLKALEEQRIHALDKSFKIAMNMAKGIVEQQTAIDVEEVKHGEWITKKYQYDVDSCLHEKYICSVCGAVEYRKYKYCHCGAKMDEGEEECVI